MAETITNGARWQDGIERRLDQNTDALNTLALRMQQQIDRLDGVLTACDKCPARFCAVEGRVGGIERFNDRLKWGLGLAGAVLMAAWGLGSKWLAKQMGW